MKTLGIYLRNIHTRTAQYRLFFIATNAVAKKKAALALQHNH